MVRDILYEVKGLLPDPVVISLEKQLRVSEDLDEEVDQAAHIFGYYAVLAEKAETRYSKMKFAYECWSAEIESRVITERQSLGVKPFTADQMKAYVRSQAKYRAYQLKLIEFSEHSRILKVISKAFEIKVELVRTKAANRRKEH